MNFKPGRKPIVYCIDGLNYLRSGLGICGDEEREMSDFLAWLESAGEILEGVSFRVILDGGHRDVGPTRRAAVSVYFSQGETADDLLVEQAVFLNSSGVKAIAVSDDGTLRERARAAGVKIMDCQSFAGFCRRALSETK